MFHNTVPSNWLTQKTVHSTHKCSFFFGGACTLLWRTYEALTKPQCVTLLVTPIPLRLGYIFLSGRFAHSKSWHDAKKKKQREAYARACRHRHHLTEGLVHRSSPGPWAAPGSDPCHMGWPRRGTPASPPSSGAVTFLTLTQGEARCRPRLSPCLVTKYQHVSALRLPPLPLPLYFQRCARITMRIKGTNLEFWAPSMRLCNFIFPYKYCLYGLRSLLLQIFLVYLSFCVDKAGDKKGASHRPTLRLEADGSSVSSAGRIKDALIPRKVCMSHLFFPF